MTNPTTPTPIPMSAEELADAERRYVDRNKSGRAWDEYQCELQRDHEKLIRMAKRLAAENERLKSQIPVFTMRRTAAEGITDYPERVHIKLPPIR